MTERSSMATPAGIRVRGRDLRDELGLIGSDLVGRFFFKQRELWGLLADLAEDHAHRCPPQCRSDEMRLPAGQLTWVADG